MIKPEMKIIKMLDWKHKSLIKPEFFPDGLCPNQQSPLVHFYEPNTNKTIQVQLVCTACQRSLIIYGTKEN